MISPMSMSESGKAKSKRIYKRWWFVLLMIVLPVLVLGNYLIVVATYGESESVVVEFIEQSQSLPSIAKEEITLMSLNLAHGRSDGPNQMWVDNDTIRQNLVQAAELIAHHKPDAVALQEADAPSWWSGDFSHTSSLARQSGLYFAAQSSNVNGLGLDYGTALIGSLEVEKTAQAHTFQRSFPTFSKGCICTTCYWPGSPEFKFCLISVHLDFANAEVRASQLDELTQLIRHQQLPVIVMGDFNTEANERLKQFLDDNQLSTWRWDASDIVTFPTFESRLDWICVSKEFVITDHSVIEKIVSDHRAIKATVRRQ